MAKRLLAVLVGLCLPALAVGPFGFDKGMTKAQIVKLIGQQAVMKSEGDIVRVNTAPTPHPKFESYYLSISPKDGLLKVLASGRTIETSDTGFELRSEFEEVRKGVIKKYGSPTNDFDFCNGGIGCDGFEYWMMGLLQKNRTLSSYWVLRDPVNGVKLIGVETNGLSLNKGWIDISYEFEGWQEYVNNRKLAQDDAY